jgi:integrase/recombinase XerD
MGGNGSWEVEAFLGYLARVRRAEATRERYRRELKAFTAWLGSRPFGTLSQSDAEQYLDFWAASFEARNGHSPAADTVRLHLTALRSFYAYLERMDWLVDEEGRPAKNRFALVEAPQRGKKPNDWLRQHEDEALLAYGGTRNERFIVHLLRWTGIRVNEARGLQVRDLDLTPGAESLRVRDSKTPHGLREIPLSPEFLLELRRWQARPQGRKSMSLNTPLLATRHGTPMHATYIWRVVKRVAFKAGVRPIACTCGAPRSAYHAEGCPRTVSGERLSEISPHTLRRTFGSHLLNNRAPLLVVSKLLGHSSVAVTQKHYAELLDPVARDEFMHALGYGRAA